MLIQRQPRPLLHIDGRLPAWLGQQLRWVESAAHPEKGRPRTVRSELIGPPEPRLRWLRQRKEGLWSSEGVLSLGFMAPRGRGM